MEKRKDRKGRRTSKEEKRASSRREGRDQERNEKQTTVLC
jgi:hypothetical protein